MGWRPEEGYYQQHVETEGYSNKITEEQKKFNKLSIDEVREGITIVQDEIEREEGKGIREVRKNEDKDIKNRVDDYREVLGLDEEER